MKAQLVDTSDGRGLSGLSEESLTGVVKALWWEAYAMREAIHRLVGLARCDVLLVAGSLRLGPGSVRSRVPAVRLHVEGECPCRDYLVDLLVESDLYLARVGAALSNPPGAVRRHIRTRVAGDWIRRRRTAMGAQARVDRIRCSVRARGLPDEFHRAVLEYLVDEAGSLAPLADDDQLHRRLAKRAAAEFGGSVASRLDDVRSALPLVERVCRTGPRSDPGDGCPLTWWERYIVLPLGRRVRRGLIEIDAVGGWVHELACAAADLAFDAVLEAPTDVLDAREAEVLGALLVLPSSNLVADVLATVLGLADRGVLPAEVAAAFVSDPGRVGAVVAVLQARSSRTARVVPGRPVPCLSG
jgi:hypothetical protein